MPSGSPATQFGEPGGPDPSVAGKKGGAATGVSVLQKVWKLLSDHKKAEALAQVAYDKALEGDFSFMRMLMEYQDGKVKQPVAMEHTMPHLSLRDRTKADSKLPAEIVELEEGGDADS